VFKAQLNDLGQASCAYADPCVAFAAETIAGSNVFKVLFPDDVSSPNYEASKAFGMMKKDTKFASDGTKYVVVSIAPGAGGSANIQTAIANQSATQQVRFSLGRKKLYEVGSIDGEALAVAKNGGGDNSKGAIVDIVKHAMSKARYAFSRTLSRAVWGSGGGARGRISGVTTGTSITLSNRADVSGFFKGMVLQSAPNDGLTTVTSPNAGTATITSVTRKTSSGTATLTASAAWDTLIAGCAANDYLFRQGDYNAYPNGIPGWSPIADPTVSDSFLSVNRFTAGDLNYLSGYRVAGAGQPKSQTLVDMATEAKQNGLDARSVLMNPLDMKDAFKEQATYKSIPVSTDNPKVGYKGIELLGSVGAMTVLDDLDVPQGYAWLINPEKDWTCRSAGETPMLFDFDGIKSFLRNPNGDDYQFRMGCYLNFENAEPNNAVVGSFA
jgi:hypothetical protein